jgi:hypothetical protein
MTAPLPAERARGGADVFSTGGQVVRLPSAFSASSVTWIFAVERANLPTGSTRMVYDGERSANGFPGLRCS